MKRPDDYPETGVPAERAPETEIRHALAEVRERGGAFVPGFLDAATVDALRTEVSGSEFEWQEQRYLKAEQRIASYVVTPPFSGYPLLESVGRRLTDIYRTAEPPITGSERYVPDHVSVHRYPPGDVGITPHYDEKRYGFLVASLTLEGSATFSIVEDPDPQHELPDDQVLAARLQAPLLESWQTGPGDLVLLRAPGFDGVPDGRPLHQVSGGRDGFRTALVYRMSAGQ